MVVQTSNPPPPHPPYSARKKKQKRSESDEAPVLAASILWKLSEYDDFVSPLLRAGAALACAAAVEELGPPQAGPLQHWLQVSVQVDAAAVVVLIAFRRVLINIFQKQLYMLQ